MDGLVLPIVHSKQCFISNVTFLRFFCLRGMMEFLIEQNSIYHNFRQPKCIVALNFFGKTNRSHCHIIPMCFRERLNEANHIKFERFDGHSHLL